MLIDENVAVTNNHTTNFLFSSFITCFCTKIGYKCSQQHRKNIMEYF